MPRTQTAIFTSEDIPRRHRDVLTKGKGFAYGQIGWEGNGVLDSMFGTVCLVK